MTLSDIFPHCIICLKKPPHGLEHVIPQSIGGRLKAPILCKKCNNDFGSELVSQLKTDPQIRLALETFKTELPDLYKKSQDKATFIGTATDGSKIRVSNQKSRKKVLYSRGQDGSIIRDTGEIPKILKKILKKGGATDQDITAALRDFAQLEEDKPLMLPTGDIVIKGQGSSLIPDLDTKVTSDRLWVLIAYEFLALAIGEHIYRDSFDAIRQYIRFNDDTDSVIVDHLSSGSQYGPFHIVYIDPQESDTHVYIRLFRWLTYRVTFRGIQYIGQGYVYFEDLKDKESYLALTIADVLKGNWYPFHGWA